MMYQKKILLVGLVALGCTILSACGSAATATPVPPTAAATQAAATQAVATNTAVPPTPTNTFATGFKSKDPTTFVSLEYGNVDTLDSALAYDSASGGILQQVYDTLVTYKRDSITELVPMLATEVPSLANSGISADGKTYTFKIRTGVKFHNGDTLTPDDVAFTFQRGILQGGSVSPQWLLTEPVLGTTADDDIADQLDPSGALVDNRDGVKKIDPAQLTAVCQKVTSAIVADDSAGTVTFKLAQSWGPFLDTLAGFWGSIQDKAWVAKNGGWDGDCATWQNFYAPTSDEQNGKSKDGLMIGKGENGTGPYTLKEWGDTQITLEANPNYWLQTPLWDGGPSGVAKIKTVIIKNISEFATRFATFQAGDGDYIVMGSAADWTQMDTIEGATCDAAGTCVLDNATNPAVRYTHQPVANRTDAFFNFKIDTSGGNTFIGSGKLDGNGVPPDFFSDIHVRKAFAYCFDWDTYIKDVEAGEGVQANDVMLTGEVGDDPNGAHYSYDPTKCASEFQASTWKSADGKSLWDVGFRLTIGYNTGNTARQSVAQIFQNNISQVNPKFKVEAQSLEWPAYLTAYQHKKLPFFIIGWIEDIPDPHNWVFTYSLGSFGGKQGMPQSLKDQFAPLVAQGAAETDPVKRAAIYKQFNQLYYDNVPAVLLAQGGGRIYLQRWVNGYYTNPLNSDIPYYALSKN
jgi:peptide/nickel transport system substrate-binding protein